MWKALPAAGGGSVAVAHDVGDEALRQLGGELLGFAAPLIGGVLFRRRRLEPSEHVAHVALGDRVAAERAEHLVEGLVGLTEALAAVLQVVHHDVDEKNRSERG